MRIVGFASRHHTESRRSTPGIRERCAWYEMDSTPPIRFRTFSRDRSGKSLIFFWAGLFPIGMKIVVWGT